MMARQTDRTRQQRRVTRTRMKLMDAARAVFAEKGLDMTRIDEITERADVGKGTFYNHFDSKEQLIIQMLKRVVGELESAIDKKCQGITELETLLDTIIKVHIEFFSNRWEDFVLYFQGRADLALEEGYAGIDTPFINCLERIETLLESVISYHLSKPVLRRIACAIAGFVSGYYSFAAIASRDEDVDEAFRSLRGAMVASLTRFVREATPSQEQA